MKYSKELIKQRPCLAHEHEHELQHSPVPPSEPSSELVEARETLQRALRELGQAAFREVVEGILERLRGDRADQG